MGRYPQGTLQERFDAKRKVDPITGCWLWTASVNDSGYGILWLPWKKTMGLAHRISWELHCGPIPEGMQVLHHCDTPPCVNPACLFLGTQADNMRDMAKKGRSPMGGTPPLLQGSKNGNARLSDEVVIAIRRRYDRGDSAASDMAIRYGVTRSVISKVGLRHSWKHVPEEQAPTVQLELDW
jgi:hypothetical protein